MLVIILGWFNGFSQIYFNSSQSFDKIIGQGTSANVLYSFQFSDLTSVYTFTGASFNLSSNLSAGDYASTKPYSVWYSYSSIFDYSAVKISTASAPIATTAGNLNFTGNTTISGYSTPINPATVYIFVTIDVSSTAGLGKNLLVSNINSVSIAGLRSTSFQSTDNSYKSTITTGSVNFSPFQYFFNFNPVSPNTINNVLGKIDLDFTRSTVLWKSFTLTTAGNYILSDIAPTGFKLWYPGSSSTTKRLLLATSPGVASGNVVKFIPINQLSATLPTVTNNLVITVDLSPTANIGDTIGFNPIPPSSLVTYAGQVNGDIIYGFKQIITNPIVTVKSNSNFSSVYTAGSTNVLLKSFSFSSVSPVGLSAITLTTGGTYLPSDLEGRKFDLWYSDNSSGISSANARLIGSYISQSTGTGESISFQNINISFNANQIPYFYLLVNISSSPGLGRTISVSNASGNQTLSLTSGLVYNNIGFGGVQTFYNPYDTITTVTIPNLQINPGTNPNVIYAFKIKPAYLNSVLQGINLTTSGTYLSSDLYTINLYYNTTGIYEDPTTQGPIWWENIYSWVNKKVFNITNLNVNLVVGKEYFFYVTVGTNPNTTNLGRTIQVTSSLPVITGSSPVIINMQQIGETVTIGSPLVTVSSQNLPDLSISRSSRDNLFYSIKLNSKARLGLDTLNLKLAGNFTNRSFSCSAWLSTDSVFDKNFDRAFQGNINITSGPAPGLKIYSSSNIPAGNNYLFLTITPEDSAKVGQYIYVTQGKMRFSGSVNANLGAGPKLTVIQPTVTLFTVTLPSLIIPTNSSEQLVYAFGVYVQGGPVNLNKLRLQLNGNFSSNDFSSAYLYTNTTGSLRPNPLTYLNIGYPKSGINTFDYLNRVLQPGMNFIYITLNSNYNATQGNTISVDRLTPQGVDFLHNVAALGAAQAGPTITIRNTATVQGFSLPESPLVPSSRFNPILAFSVSNAKFTYPTSISAGILGNNGQSNLTNYWLMVCPTAKVINCYGSYYGTYSNNKVTFSGLNSPNVNNAYYIVTAEVLSSANLGNVVTCTANSSTDLTWVPGTIKGSFNLTNSLTVTGPNIQLSTPRVLPGKNIGIGSTDTVYTFELESNFPFRFSDFIISTTGTAFNNMSVLPYFVVYQSPNPDLSNAVGFGTFDPYNYTTVWKYYPESNRDFPAGKNYFFITAFTDRKTKTGSTLGFKGIDPSQIKINTNATISGFAQNGSIYTVVPAIVQSGTPEVSPARITRASRGNVLYKFWVTNTPVSTVLDSIHLTAKGTYTNRDITSFNLYASTSSSVNVNALSYISSFTPEISGERITFLPYENFFKSYYTLRGDTTYFFVTANVGQGAKIGNTVYIEPMDIPNSLFLRGTTATGSSIAGGIQTIDYGYLTIGNFNLTSKSVGLGEDSVVVYILPLTVSGAGIQLTKIKLDRNQPTYNRYVDLSRKGFYYWLNSVPGLNNATLLTGINSDTGSVGFNVNTGYIIHPGNYYLIVSANISNNAFIGNTINLGPINNSDITSTGDVLGYSSQYNMFTITGAGIIPPNPIDIVTDIEPYSLGNYFQIFPNPSSNLININLSNKYVGNDSPKAILYGMSGDKISTTDITIGTNVLDVSNVTNGLYILKIYSKESFLIQRIVILK